MSTTAAKARRLRLERLTTMLERRLEHAPAALETLMSELKLGENQTALWEALHAAAARDGREPELAEAYQKVAISRRLKDVTPEAHAKVLMHAADFFQGALGDRDGARRFLERVLEVVPSHTEAFSRLQRRFEADGSSLELLQLYARVASDPPVPAERLARTASDELLKLKTKAVLTDEYCEKLLVLGKHNTRILDVLETHLKKSSRAPLAAKLRERAIDECDLREGAVVEQRRALIDLYLGDVGTPAAAMPHVEALLERDASDRQARAAAEKLLSTLEVASRAAAALRALRKAGSN